LHIPDPFRATSVLAITLAAALLADGCGRTPYAAAELRLAVDSASLPLALPVFVTAGRGLAASRGLRLTLVEFPDARRVTDAVLRGDCQFGVAGFEQVLRARAAGRSLTAVALVARSPMLSLVAGPRPARRPGDPPGDAVAVVADGDATALFARYLTDARPVAQGSMDAAAAAFTRHQTAAAVLDAATLARLDAAAVYYSPRADTRTPAGLLEVYGTSNYPAACLYAGTGWIADHRDPVERLAAAVVEALAWIGSRPAGELPGMLPDAWRRGWDPTLLEGALAAYQRLYSRDGTFTADGVDAARKVLAASEGTFRTAPVPPGAYANEFLPAARTRRPRD
jgi:NitT/TauT family transport system substrate-binding protein